MYTHIYELLLDAGRGGGPSLSYIYKERGTCRVDAILPITLFSLSQVKFKHVKRVYRKKSGGGDVTTFYTTKK
jgi:hypothetical protein